MAGTLDRPPWFLTDFEMRVVDTRLTDFHRYWLSIRDGGDVARFERFDPLDVTPFLGDLFMVRVENAGAADAEPMLRYTLIGTRLVEAIGRDSTGQLVEDTFPPGHPIVPAYRIAITRRVPFRTHGLLAWVDKGYRRFESIMLPMADDRGRIAKIVGAAYYEPADSGIVGSQRTT